jgi:hypothetical protein
MIFMKVYGEKFPLVERVAIHADCVVGDFGESFYNVLRLFLMELATI